MFEEQIFHLLTQEYSLVQATTEEDFSEVKKIRKEVIYTKYKKYAVIENEEQFLFNEDDAQSFIYLLQHNDSQKYVGTIRVFFLNETTPSSDMPMQRDGHVNDIQNYTKRLPICEVSRLALSHDLPHHETFTALRLRTYLTIGLMSTIGINIFLYKYTYIFSVMDPYLHRILKRQGINFKAIGKIVDYYGMGIPYAIERENLIYESKDILAQITLFYLKKLAQDPDDFWKFIDDNRYLKRSDIQLDKIIKLFHTFGGDVNLSHLLTMEEETVEQNVMLS